MHSRGGEAQRVCLRGLGRARSLALALAFVGAGTLVSTAAGAAAEARHVSISFSCAGVTFTYSGFPDGLHNMRELVLLEGVIVREAQYPLDGSSGTSTVGYNVPAGAHEERAEAQWNIGGVSGESARRKELLACQASKPLSINELQRIAESGLPFEAAELKAHYGETVEYQTIVINTGDVPLLLNDFTDPNCEAETIRGPGETTLAPEAETVYTCDRALTEAGAYENSAIVTATPSGGKPVSERSNPVVTTVVPKPRLEIAAFQEIHGSGAGFTTSMLSASVGQTVDYQVIIRNSGNQPLDLSEFGDPYCDRGTLSGGLPFGQSLRPEQATTYRCSHWLSEAGAYYNVASVVGNPPDGEAIVEASNVVTVKARAGGTPSGVISPPGGNGGASQGAAEAKAKVGAADYHARLRAALAKALDPSGRSARLRALLRAGGMWVFFSAPTAGHLVISWYQLSKRAHAAAKAQPLLIARGKVAFAAPATKRVFVRLTSEGKRLLRSATRISLTARGSFTPTGAATLVIVKSIVLKR